MKKSGKIWRKYLRELLPPFFLKALCRISPRDVPINSEYKTISYQHVTQGKFLYEMHEGAFSEILEKYSKLDSHINSDSNEIRLRVYNLCTWAQLALNNTKNGDFLSAGISFGTFSLVTSEYLKLEKHNRSQFFIDPMDGRGRGDYNTDRSLVESRWNSAIPLIWIQEPLSPSVIEKIGPIAFAHLNTGAWEAETECIPLVYERLVKGGILVMDYYGWMPREKQLVVNRILNDLGAKFFISPSLQLAVFR